MAMGTRRHRQRQEGLWYGSELPEAPGLPFYQRLNQVLDKAGFDEFCESRSRKFYHEKLGRPSLVPGMYFRLMLIGFFEGIDSERGIACRPLSVIFTPYRSRTSSCVRSCRYLMPSSVTSVPSSVRRRRFFMPARA